MAVVGALTMPAVLSSQQAVDERSRHQNEKLVRGRNIQSALAMIEANKAAFVKQMLESWVPHVDQAYFDPVDELYDIAMRAPAWQVYGASLSGDFKTMVDILRGRVPAGTLIGTLHQPQARTFATPQFNLLGDTTSELVFNPIPPCRIVDTRGTGARTGILAANTSRTFDLTTRGYTEGQGGQTSGCTGLPPFSHYAWAVNITVADYTGNGGLQVYPFGGTVPATSLINYFPGAYALANNGTVTGCYGCSDDITVRAFGAATHVIIDVMGYFQEATGTMATVTSVPGAGQLVTAGNGAFSYGGDCPTGTVLIGGEVSHNGLHVSVGEFEQDPLIPQRWRAWIFNSDPTSQAVVVYSRCLDTPMRHPS